MTTDYSKLKRDRHSMPDFVKKALDDEKLMEDYLDRPAYQQNDYVGWIIQAKLEKTKQKRLNQMLKELKTGGIYMKMPHPPSAKK
ncbi:MAG: YdeI/OmpD-associated family protein [Spirochaetota bacterium]|nr:YdeI/OmpD-associated family protein [Spirochaetota bacterium]